MVATIEARCRRRAGARRGSGRHLQHHRKQGAAHSGTRTRRRGARWRRDDLPGAGVPHQLLGTSRLRICDHFLTPDFSAYQQSALTSPYPHNGAVADLAHAQGALVGYVHPFDWESCRKGEVADERVAGRRRARQGGLHRSGRFPDHKATAAVWHRLLNRIQAVGRPALMRWRTMLPYADRSDESRVPADWR